MDTAQILVIVKDALGIKSTARDPYISVIIEGVIKELEDEKGIALDLSNGNHLLFVVDYVVWKFSNKEANGMPRHLQFKLHNLSIHDKVEPEVII